MPAKRVNGVVWAPLHQALAQQRGVLTNHQKGSLASGCMVCVRPPPLLLLQVLMRSGGSSLPGAHPASPSFSFLMTFLDPVPGLCPFCGEVDLALTSLPLRVRQRQ